METFTVWVQEEDLTGTCHVSSHEARTAAEAASLAFDETLRDWGWPDARIILLRVLGIAKGKVELVEWND